MHIRQNLCLSIQWCRDWILVVCRFHVTCTHTHTHTNRRSSRGAFNSQLKWQINTAFWIHWATLKCWKTSDLQFHSNMLISRMELAVSCLNFQQHLFVVVCMYVSRKYFSICLELAYFFSPSTATSRTYWRRAEFYDCACLGMLHAFTWRASGENAPWSSPDADRSAPPADDD